MARKTNNILLETEKEVQKALKAHGRYFRSRRLERERLSRTGGKGTSAPHIPPPDTPAAEADAPMPSKTGKSAGRPVALFAGKGYMLFNIMLVALFLGGSGYLVYLIMTYLK